MCAEEGAKASAERQQSPGLTWDALAGAAGGVERVGAGREGGQSGGRGAA